MALTISSTLRDWKNADSRPDPVVYLYDVSIDDSTTLRLVEGNPTGTGSVTYDGNTYQAAAIVREDVTQNVEGDLPSFRVAVSNIDGVAGGYIEQYDLQGRTVTITAVPLETLDTADALVETYTIQDQTYNRTQASFVLGAANFFRRRTPAKRYLRDKCSQIYEGRFLVGNGCGYPSDDFAEDSEQVLIVGSQGAAEDEKLHGWYLLNGDELSSADMNISMAGYLYLESSQVDIDWRAGQLNAPFVYKQLSGDFAVYTGPLLLTGRENARAGILCQESDQSLDSWVFWSLHREIGGTLELLASAAEDGVGQADQPFSLEPSYIRMTRAGSGFTLASASDPDGTWTDHATLTVTMSSNTRIGLSVSATAAEATPAIGAFEMFRFLSGGLATCDRTLDGENGCSIHKNTRRMFAFPGIPRI